MYDDLDPSIVRYLMRKVRKEMELRQEDVADEEMSYGTISNIERGVGNVNEKNVYSYLEKLGLTEKRLKKLVTKEEERIDDLTFQLESIESMLNNNKVKQAEKILKNIPLERYHPLSPFYTYLEGRCYEERRDWQKAEKYYKFAIRLHTQYKLNTKDNIISVCYNELSICSYNQNQLDKAQAYVEKGLNEFDENKEGKSVLYALVSNKVLYLLKSSEYDAAKQTLDEVWSLIPQIDSTRTILNLYRFRAMILRKMKKYAEALKICQEGIDIALRNRNQNRYLELITVMGSIYLLEKKFEKAKQRFQMVLDYDPECEYPRSQLDALTYLSILHSNEKNWTEAEKNIEQAIEIGRNIPDLYRLSKALIVCGNIHLDQSKFEEASSFYREAEELSEKNRYNQRQHTALLQLTYCFAKMKKEEDWNSYMKKLLNLQREINLQSEDEIYVIR